jgi:flagellar L-ring protein FlgH
MKKHLACLAALLLLSGCGSLQRLSEVGRPPAMTPSSDPTADPKWRPVNLPMPSPEAPPIEAENSLWRAGSRAFFKDQRASQVGDIVTVVVNIADVANLQNNSSQGNTGSESMGMPNMFGLEGALPHIIKAATASSLVSTNSAGNSTGTGQIKRNETVQLRLAGVVTQVMSNGNLVVAARQEVRVNSELRELDVTGVVRPQDIASDNTVQHDRMAEARIAYGGRGQLSDHQTPRWGQQVLDIVLPF